MAKATAATTKFSSAQLAAASKNSAAFRTIGVASLVFAGVLGFALKSAAGAAIDFESSFAGVRKTVDATEPEFEALAQGIRDMAKEIPVAVNDLNKIAETAGQLGIAKGDILEFTRVVADMGATTDLAGDDAAAAFARIGNIMGIAHGEFDNLGSAIVALGNAGASTESEIVDFALRIAGAGKIAGLTTADILGIGNAMASLGIPAERGGTAVQKVLLSITQAVVTGSDKVRQYGAVAGMSAEEFARAWRMDPMSAFASFVEGLGVSGDKAIGILTDLGLTDQRTIQSFLSLAASGDMLRTSTDLGTKAWEENVALVDEANKRYDTTASKITIAANKMNDAAISFGEVMLPAIAAVVGVFGDLADAFSSIPGPVRAVIVVVAVAATGMAALAGASLLLQGKLLQLKVAMAAQGRTGNLFVSSLKSAAAAINPVTIGLTAGVLVLGAWAESKAEAKRATEEFTAAIAADSGVLGENTRQMLINQLSSKGLLDTLKEMGLSTEAVTDDILAMADGNKEAEARTMALLDSMSGSEMIAFAGIIKALGGGVHDYKLEVEAAGDATDEAGGAAGGATPLFDELGNKIEDTTTKAEALKKALDDLAGTELDVEKANLAWLDSIAGINDELTHEINAQGKLTSTLKKGVKQLDEHTEAGRAAREEILNSIDAAIEHGAAVAEETGSLKKGAAAVERHIGTLIDEAVEAGISRDAIKDYIGQLNLTPSQVKTAIQLLGVDKAKTDILGIQSMLNLVEGTYNAVVNVLPGSGGGGGGLPHGIDHAGGTIGASGPRRLHAGGNLRADEEMVIGQRGERMLSAREWHALRSITGTGAAAPHVRSSSSEGGRVVKVFVRADRRRWTDELDHDVTYAGRWAS